MSTVRDRQGVAIVLRRVADEVDGMVRYFDRSSYVCSGCGTNRFANWEDEQDARDIEAIVNRLRGRANKLDEGG